MRLNKQRILEYNQRVAPSLAAQALELGLFHVEEQAYPFGRTMAEVEWSKQGGYARGLYPCQPCYIPWVHALITPQGQVHPCCMLRSPPPVGNFIQAGGFRQVWLGSRYQDFRGEMLGGSRPALCQACDDFLEVHRQLHEVMQAA